MEAAFDAVMLIGFGGPTRPDEIRPFLDNVLRGRPVSPARLEAVVAHYDRIGGRSPYNELTLGQAAALGRELAGAGIAIPVAVGMRNWSPYFIDTLAALERAGARRVLGFIMSAFQCEASWQRYQQAVADARARLGSSAPEVEYVAPWSDDALFIEAAAARLADAVAMIAPAARRDAQVIFTAHSIPVAMAAQSPYVDQLTDAARRVATALAIENWTIAFQSRSGDPREPWLEPDIRDALRAVRSRDAIVMPLGFLCDHVEVLYDLDIEAAEIARVAGLRMIRAATVGDHPAFIRMMATVVRRRLEGGAGR
ncbi:MAG TPA: ferrochelatase [Candidatus Binataceae bacterium]|nr:ferrochelatase [Candidatus Binataceae bacterium]